MCEYVLPFAQARFVVNERRILPPSCHSTASAADAGAVLVLASKQVPLRRRGLGRLQGARPRPRETVGPVWTGVVASGTLPDRDFELLLGLLGRPRRRCAHQHLL